MEKAEKQKSQEEIMSCWERLKMKILSKKGEGNNNNNNNNNNNHLCMGETNGLNNNNRSGGLFRYDPLSYAQNFDEGLANADEEGPYRSFSARYAVPSKPPAKKLE